jgi:hypothetical protein
LLAVVKQMQVKAANMIRSVSEVPIAPPGTIVSDSPACLSAMVIKIASKRKSAPGFQEQVSKFAAKGRPASRKLFGIKKRNAEPRERTAF